MKSKNTTNKTKNIPLINQNKNKVGFFKSFFNKTSSLNNKFRDNVNLGPIVSSFKIVKKTLNNRLLL